MRPSASPVLPENTQNIQLMASEVTTGNKKTSLKTSNPKLFPSLHPFKGSYNLKHQQILPAPAFQTPVIAHLQPVNDSMTHVPPSFLPSSSHNQKRAQQIPRPAFQTPKLAYIDPEPVKKIKTENQSESTSQSSQTQVSSPQDKSPDKIQDDFIIKDFFEFEKFVFSKNLLSKTPRKMKNKPDMHPRSVSVIQFLKGQTHIKEPLVMQDNLLKDFANFPDHKLELIHIKYHQEEEFNDQMPLKKEEFVSSDFNQSGENDSSQDHLLMGNDPSCLKKEENLEAFNLLKKEIDTTIIKIEDTKQEI